VIKKFIHFLLKRLEEATAIAISVINRQI